jgi:hypothetical protein
VLKGRGSFACADIKRTAHAGEYASEFFIGNISPLGIHYERYRVIP